MRLPNVRAHTREETRIHTSRKRMKELKKRGGGKWGEKAGDQGRKEKKKRKRTQRKRGKKGKQKREKRRKVGGGAKEKKKEGGRWVHYINCDVYTLDVCELQK